MTQTNQPANSNNSLHPVLPVRAPGGASPTTNEHVDQYAQNAVNEGKQISALLAEILKTSSVAGNAESNLHLVLSLAEDLRNYQSPIEFSIGLVGDSGVGKSSLINSLLDTNDLAKTAGNGSACTTVVTEYRQKRPCDTAPFTIEVQCMEDQEIQDLLQQCIVDYRRYHLLDRSGIEAPERSEIERLGAKAKLAWDTILAAFGDYNECCEERFQDPHNETDAIILMVLGWKDQIPWSQNGLHNRITSLTATEEKQCSIQIEECLKSLKWPFIKVVRIYLEAKVLEKGIVLVDLPGSSTLILPSSFYIRSPELPEQPEQSMSKTHYSPTSSMSQGLNRCGRMLAQGFIISILLSFSDYPGEPKQAPRIPNRTLMKIDLLYVINHSPR